MGGCALLCQNPSKDFNEVQVNSNPNNTNKKGGKGLKRKKTKFPKRGEIKDDVEEEEKDQKKNN